MGLQAVLATRTILGDASGSGVTSFRALRAKSHEPEVVIKT